MLGIFLSFMDPGCCLGWWGWMALKCWFLHQLNTANSVEPSLMFHSLEEGKSLFLIARPVNLWQVWFRGLMYNWYIRQLMFHCIKAKLFFCQLLHSPRAKSLELAHLLAIWSLSRDVVKKESWEEHVRGLKFFHIFPDRNLLGRTFVVMPFFVCKALWQWQALGSAGCHYHCPWSNHCTVCIFCDVYNLLTGQGCWNAT